MTPGSDPAGHARPLVRARLRPPPMPRETTRLELLDRPDVSPAELAGCLTDLARLNRIGPIWTLLAHLAPFFDEFPPERPLRVLDVGTGSADVPVALTRWARRRGHRVSVFALDAQPKVLVSARRRVVAFPEIRLVAGEALAPPVRPGGIDLAICSLMLHHLPEEAVIRFLARLARLGRLGFVVSDLRRCRAAYAAAWLLTRAVSRNRLTRHDGPLSVRRAYTETELARLSSAAGLPGLRWHRAIAFRVIGIYRPSAPEGL